MGWLEVSIAHAVGGLWGQRAGHQASPRLALPPAAGEGSMNAHGLRSEPEGMACMVQCLGHVPVG